ncbi:MAG: hypothetical protein KDA52_09015 [Planctomycetaceae bacterium]|nr:hypothetical protein [Planctomycetaceae bacterium]
MSRKRPPKYSHHKASGQARVRLNGQDVYLGVYGSPESHERYAKLVEDWMKAPAITFPEMSIGQLTMLYLEHAKRHYVKNGTPTSQIHSIRLVLRYLNRLYNKCLASEFSPRMLKAVRDEMIRAGYVRTSINAHVSRIRRMFEWAVSEEIIPPHVLVALKSVQGLQAGRTEAVESDPVSQVSNDHVEAVLPHVSAQINTMIQLQQLTGMRPGEVLIMRPCDITMTTDGVWKYRPEAHKTEHHGKE